MYGRIILISRNSHNMMSALGGEGEREGTPKAHESTEMLRECDSDKGEGGPKIQTFLGMSYVHAP